MAAPATAVLKDVVAYVEVWSSNGTENYSKTFTSQLVDMGAKVSKTFNKQVTHVVFKDGYQSTWDKAWKRGIKLVSVLWVEKCRTAGVHADESLFPAPSPSEHTLSLMRKKRKCMQPKDFIPRTPDNDKRLQRKFEKMTEELQRQKTALDDSVPVFFEPCSSLTCSALIKISSPQHTMEKRLQEMKEKREHLSPTSSQRTESAQENPDNILCGASLNVSQGTSYADESFGGGSCSSSDDDLCGNQERKSGQSVKETTSAVCGSSPVLSTSHMRSPASSSCPSELNPQKPTSDLPEEGISWPRGPDSEIVTPGKKRATEVSEMGEKRGTPSPVTSAAGRRRWLHSASRSSSTKRKRMLAGSCSPLKETPRKKRSSSSGWRPAGRGVQLLGSGYSLQFPSTSTLGTPDSVASSYEDYFSPENLEERTSRNHLPGSQPSAGPACFSPRSLSQRERASVLEMSDFSCIGEKLRLGSITDLTAKAPSRLWSPTCVAAEDPPAAEANPGHCGQAGHPRGRDAGTTGGCHPTTHNPAGPGQEDSSCSPVQGSRTEGGLAGKRGTQKELPAATVPECPLESAQERELSLGEEQSAEEEKENAALQYSGNVENRPTKHSVSAGSQEGVEDLIAHHEMKSKPRGKNQQPEPTRTLVMTSMSSEKQSIIMQVVDTLKGFSLVPEVCETTTHVLAGKPLRTLNVLLGIARGCWVLSFEWVLWSLELGHWISEEPFELSTHFPAAPICRHQRDLCPRQYRGTLFVDQPPMYISLASSPPRAKLCELVLLSGGCVTRDPRHAGLLVGPHGRGRKTAATAAQHLSEKWILDSITQHRICDFENYLLHGSALEGSEPSHTGEEASRDDTGPNSPSPELQPQSPLCTQTRPG